MRKSVLVALFLFAATLNAQTADQLWSELMAGNQLFVNGQVVYGSLQSTRRMWATGQDPAVAILSCADSRVPAEIVFGRTVGELFVVRVAGNVDDTFGVASFEYAIAPPQRWTKLLVVMGHSDCGAVNASLTKPEEGKPTPSLYALITRIRRSFTPGTQPNLYDATIMNINFTANALSKNALIATVPVIRAYYDVATGKVVRLP